MCLFIFFIIFLLVFLSSFNLPIKFLLENKRILKIWCEEGSDQIRTIKGYHFVTILNCYWHYSCGCLLAIFSNCPLNWKHNIYFHYASGGGIAAQGRGGACGGDGRWWDRAAVVVDKDGGLRSLKEGEGVWKFSEWIKEKFSKFDNANNKGW